MSMRAKAMMKYLASFKPKIKSTAKGSAKVHHHFSAHAEKQ